MNDMREAFKKYLRTAIRADEVEYTIRSKVMAKRRVQKRDVE
jgi:hypothetical protein